MATKSKLRSNCWNDLEISGRRMLCKTSQTKSITLFNVDLITQLKVVQQKANDCIKQSCLRRSPWRDQTLPSGVTCISQAAKQPLSQPSSQRSNAAHRQACYTRNKRLRITHTVILSTSHQWTALHNTLCRALTQRLQDG